MYIIKNKKGKIFQRMQRAIRTKSIRINTWEMIAGQGMWWLRGGDKGPNIPNSWNEEGHGLEKQVYEVTVLSEGKIIAPTKEEIGSHTKLLHMHSVHTCKQQISLPIKLKSTQQFQCEVYLSPILRRGFLEALVVDLILRASPSFSVTTHSFTLPASNKPINVALVLCIDITFSNSTQKINRWSDLQNNTIKD